MGKDIRIVVEVLDGDRWRHEFEVPLEHPAKTRDLEVFDRLASSKGTSILGRRGLPLDADPSFLERHPNYGSLFEIRGASGLDLMDHLGDYGFSWGTLAELRQGDWSGLEDRAFPARICSEPFEILEREGGADGLRILIGFNG